jgi:uncharacterized metal-binding protein
VSAGRTHRKASLILASAFGVGAIISSHPEMIQCAVGSIVGIMVTPDADVDSGTIANKIIRTKMGRPWEKVWRWFWKPYSKSFKHGLFASHFPVFSTYVRLFYVSFMLLPAFYIPYILILYSSNYYIDLIQESLWWGKLIFVSWYTVGLCSSDLIHYSLDKLTWNLE